jgi:hypothetical protein
LGKKRASTTCYFNNTLNKQVAVVNIVFLSVLNFHANIQIESGKIPKVTHFNLETKGSISNKSICTDRMVEKRIPQINGQNPKTNSLRPKFD